MEECSVCSDNLDDRPTRNIPCGHRFHCDCLTQWTQAGHGTCPLCRHEFQGKFRCVDRLDVVNALRFTVFAAG